MMIRFFAAFLVVSLFSYCGPAYEQVPTAEVDQTEAAKAKALGLKILNACERANYPTLSPAEATLIMVEGMTTEKQREACDYLQQTFGKFLDLSLGEVLRSVGSNDFRIYRYKGSFEGTDEIAEIRITLNKEGKMSGIWTRPWREGL